MKTASLANMSDEELLRELAQIEELNKSPVEMSDEEILRELSLIDNTSSIAPESPTIDNRLTSLGKAAVAGAVGGLADLATAPYNMGAAAHNFQRENMDPEVLNAAARFNPDMPGVPYDVELPMIPSATEAIDSGIDSLTGGYTRTPEGQRWLNEGVKFGASLASPGGLAKAGVKGMSALGTLRPAGLAGGFAAGATGEALRDEGAAASLGGSLGAGLVVDAIVRNPSRRLINVMGYGKNSLNTKAYDAAQSLGLDLPNIAFTKGNLPTAVHSFEKRLPYFGDKLREKMERAGVDFKNKFEDLLENEVGQGKTPARMLKKNELYETVEKLLAEESDIDVSSVIEAIKQYKQKKPPGASKKRSSVLNTLDDFAESVAPSTKNIQIGGRPLEEFNEETRQQVLQQIGRLSESSPTLTATHAWEQKKDWNDTINELGGYSPAKDPKAPVARLHNINETLKTELREQLSEEAATALKMADEFYAAGAKRDAVDKLLGEKLHNYLGDISYTGLAKAFHSPEGKKTLQIALGEDGYRKAEQFIDVAKSIVKIGDINPSGSGALVLIATLLKALVVAPAKPVISLAAKALFKNKKLINIAMGYAKEPTLSRAQKLEKLFQEEFGMSAQSLIKSINSNEKAPQ